MLIRPIPLLLIAGTIVLGLAAFGCGDDDGSPHVTLRFAPDALAAGTVGEAYDVTFEPVNAVTPISSFRLASGEIPPGLELYECGPSEPPCEQPLRLHGVPATAGTYEFTVFATTFGTQQPGRTGERSFTLRIDPAGDSDG